MNEVPEFWTFWLPLLMPVLMVLAVYRLTRLITKDDFPPVLWLRDRLVGGYRPPTRAETWHPGYPAGELEPHVSRAAPGLRGLWSLDSEGNIQVWRAPWKHTPHWLAELLSCPWCVSGWLSGAVVLAADLTVGLPVPWLFGPAVWGAAALLASREWA
jgi:hypothetical protein